ncbi:DNA methyltransferase [Ligilactobacillus sp. LYQ135]
MKFSKSDKRVKKHGEVFTPLSTVNLMLNQPEVQEKINNLSATFLEPAAGEGAFLIELLKRKMDVAYKKSDNIKDYDYNTLLAISSLYGIELLSDNLRHLRINMMSTFKNIYQSDVKKFNKNYNKKVLKSAQVIIESNMVQGDTLTRKKKDGSPIIFSEWKQLPEKYGVKKISRIEYTFDSIISGEDEPLYGNQNKTEQLDLFCLDDDSVNMDTVQYKYKVVSFEDVYKELKEEI